MRFYLRQFDALQTLMLRARGPPRGLHVDAGQATREAASGEVRVSRLPRAFAAVSGIAKAAAATIITRIVRIPYLPLRSHRPSVTVSNSRASRHVNPG
jgi:hypothetical protein